MLPYPARNTFAKWDPDLTTFFSLCHLGPKLPSKCINQEEGGTISLHYVAGHKHYPINQPFDTCTKCQDFRHVQKATKILKRFLDSPALLQSLLKSKIRPAQSSGHDIQKIYGQFGYHLKGPVKFFVIDLQELRNLKGPDRGRPSTT